MLDDTLYEVRVPRFDKSLDEDYEPCGVRLETALESQQLARELTFEKVNKRLIDA